MLIPCFSRQHNPGFSLFFKSKVSASCHIKCGVATISIATIYHKHYLKTRNVVQDLLGFNQEGLTAYGIQISELIKWYMTFTVQNLLHVLFFIGHLWFCCSHFKCFLCIAFKITQGNVSVCAQACNSTCTLSNCLKMEKYIVNITPLKQLCVSYERKTAARANFSQIMHESMYFRW